MVYLISPCTLIDLDWNRVGGSKFDNTYIQFVSPRQQYMVGPERLYLASRLNLTEAQVGILTE